MPAENARATADDLGTHFVPSAVEGPLYDEWVDKGYFEGRPQSEKPPFCVVLPPPNVTGNLHIGHAFEHTLIDAVVRRRRMMGYDAVWIPGLDHAGIATQNVVERQLQADGLTRHDLGRAAFVAKVWEWKAQSGGLILDQMRRLGDSVDWSRERFTMDEDLSRAVRVMFKRLHDDGLIYRAERIINWCPSCLTALSDIEVEHYDEPGELVEVEYVSENSDARIPVATTRLETILGDTAIAVHPDDERYSHLVGRMFRVPIADRLIPVIADRYVDPSFGTGAIKVTPAHDPNDFEIGRRHALPSITMMSEAGVVEGTNTVFDGMDRFAARKAVRSALASRGQMLQERRPYLHSVGHCSRSKDVVEPRLSLQWFVKVSSLAARAGDAVRDGRVRVLPTEMEPRWFAWVDNMHDWCISRQLWWGHRIPVWYGPDGQVMCLGPDEQVPEGWVQDTDVLDTWFSSGLWPFSTLGWPRTTPDLARYYPNAVLITGYDILFFWVARMMMFGLYAHDGDAPFPDIVLHGMVRDAHGKKMSKSFGNVVDPIEWMDTYGSDAVRFTFARGANPGADVPIGEEGVHASRNFCTKLFNAVRFALLNGATTAGPVPPADVRSLADRWILTRLDQVALEVDAAYEQFEFSKAADRLYHFVWDELCDWYLELAKNVGAVDRRVVGEVFDAVLRLLHPLMPFITETLWRALTGGNPAAEESLVIASWPTRQRGIDPKDLTAVAAMGLVQRAVTDIRRFRAEQALPPTRKLPARLTSGFVSESMADARLQKVLVDHVKYLARLADSGADFAPSLSLTIEGLRVELDVSGIVDIGAERARLLRDLALAEKLRDSSSARLANHDFLSKAPSAVVAEIRGRLDTAASDIERLTRQLDALTILG